MDYIEGATTNVFFNKSGPQSKFTSERRIKDIRVTSEMPVSWVKKDDYRGYARMYSWCVQEKMESFSSDDWDKIKQVTAFGPKLKKAEQAKNILSIFNFAALETVKCASLTAFLDKKTVGGMSETLVRGTLAELFAEEKTRWEGADPRQIAGIKSLWDKYKSMDCIMSRLVMMQLDRNFAKLSLTQQSFRSALAASDYAVQWTEIELSHRIANTIIPEAVEQWYRECKARSKNGKVNIYKLNNLASLLAIMTVEQLQKLFLRDGRYDVNCSLICLAAQNSSIRFENYHLPIVILKNPNSHNDASKSSTVTSVDNLSHTPPPLPPVAELQLSNPGKLKAYFCWFADHTASSEVVSEVPTKTCMQIFNFPAGNMVLTPDADGRQRADDFTLQLWQELG